MKVLITGGTGYIGSHCAVMLLEKNFEVVLLDNLSNSFRRVCNQIQKITKKKISFIEGDINDKKLLEGIFISHKIDIVLHFAGLKAVNESVKEPKKYYQNNVQGTLCLMDVMEVYGISKLVFSSSATVYGDPEYLPMDENHPLKPLHPYGENKILIEKMLKDQTIKNSSWKVLSLRYFNPIGAHKSNLIGEFPSGHPNNLLPYIMQVAAGKRPRLKIFGNNYSTPDGTGLRDYIHIDDLVEGHIAAINYLFNMKENNNFDIFNLGTGSAYSVLEVLESFENVSGCKIPYVFSEKREGDIQSSYADVSKARSILNWKAVKSLDEMCMSVWQYQKNIF